MNCFLSKLSHTLAYVVIFGCFSISTQGNAIAASLTGKLYYSTYQLNLATGVRKDILGVSKYFGVSTDSSVYATIKSPYQKISIVTAAGRLEREFFIKNPSPASAIKFSPSGKKLVYQEDPYGSNYKLNIVDRSNGKLIVNLNLNLKTSAPYSSYDWLDENRLVVARAKDIFVIDLSASHKTGQLRGFKLTSKPFISDVFLPAVQPGGKKNSISNGWPCLDDKYRWHTFKANNNFKVKRDCFCIFPRWAIFNSW